MLFPTVDFLLFAVPVLTVFWLLAGRPMARVVFLLAASYFFYMAGPKTEPPPAPWYYVGLLVFLHGVGLRLRTGDPPARTRCEG